MKNWKNSKWVLAVTLAAGLAIGTLASNGVRTVFAATAGQSAAAPDATPLAIPDPVQLSTTFTKLAKQLEPSVVQVTSTVEQKNVRQRRGFEPPNDDFFRRFFGDDDPFGGVPTPQRPFRSQGVGSGFVVDKNGYILTNNHVVDGATKIRVKLHDDSNEYAAKVVGSDPELDLAVLKIDAGHPLQQVKIGNSDGVQVGDWAVAIGSPFGLEATVTAGIVSGLGRDLGVAGHQLQRFLQTDASINPGNSGGPLLNIRGEVVGVNTMIATSSGASEGVGFALPINMAVNAYNQIIKTGKVSRGAIGVEFQRESKPELLKVYGATHGVLVTRVTPGSPADKAGLKDGDIITEFNSKPVKDGEDLVNMVSQTPVGTKTPIEYLRDGKKMNTTLQVGDRSEIVAGNTRTGGADEGSSEGQPAKLGMSVRGLRPAERDRMQLADTGGVLITDVDGGSFAEDIGAQPGDVLTAINRQPVSSVDDVKRIASSLKPGDPVAVRVLRNVAARVGGRADWRPLFLSGTLPAGQ